MEIWKPCRNISGYSVSNKGKVKSETKQLMRSNGRPHTVPGKILAGHTDTSGHVQFSPYINKKRKHIYVHREVFETFIRPLNPGEQVDHIDSNKTNNILENLQAVANQTEHWKFTWARIEKEIYDKGYSQGYQDAKNKL